MPAKPNIFYNAMNSFLNLCGVAWAIFGILRFIEGEPLAGLLWALFAITFWREIDMREIKRKLDRITKLMEE